MQNRLKHFYNQILKSLFIKQVASLGAGTVTAHLITLAFSPVITRLYTAEQIGEYSLFHSFVVVLSVLATLTYEYAIVLPKKNSVARNVFLTGFFSTLIFSALLFFAGMIFMIGISGWLDVSLLFVILLPFGVLANALLSLFTNWFIRRAQYKKLSFAKITQSSVMGGTQTAFGFTPYTNAGMLVGYVVGRVAYIIHLSVTKMRDIRYIFKRLRSREIFKAAKTYADQPRYVLIATLLSVGALEIPVFIIGALFDKELLGFYGLAIRVVSAPIMFIGTSVSHVFFQNLADKKNRGEKLTPILLKTWAGLAVIGILPFLILFFYAEPIFSFVFGADWIMAGTVASILTPLLFVQFISSPTGKSLMVVEDQRMMPFFSLLQILARGLSLLVGALYFDFMTGLWLMIASHITTLLMFNIYLYYKLKTFRPF